jgi:hypothetical protein
MTKVFIYDESRIHHHDACIAGNDFGDCYDRTAHQLLLFCYNALEFLNLQLMFY